MTFKAPRTDGGGDGRSVDGHGELATLDWDGNGEVDAADPGLAEFLARRRGDPKAVIAPGPCAVIDDKRFLLAAA